MSVLVGSTVIKEGVEGGHVSVWFVVETIPCVAVEVIGIIPAKANRILGDAYEDRSALLLTGVATNDTHVGSNCIRSE